MKIRTRTEDQEGMRQTIARAMLRNEERIFLSRCAEAMPPACETIDEDIAFAAVPEDSMRPDSPHGLLAPAPRRFFGEVAHA